MTVTLSEDIRSVVEASVPLFLNSATGYEFTMVGTPGTNVEISEATRSVLGGNASEQWNTSLPLLAANRDSP